MTNDYCAAEVAPEGNDDPEQRLGLLTMEPSSSPQTCCSRDLTTTTSPPAAETPTTSAVGPTKLQLQLLKRAASVRKRLGSTPPPHYLTDQDLFFPSKYWQCNKDAYCNHNNNSKDNALKNGDKNDEIHERGFCNWLVPNKIMIGQYPGQNPLPDGPSKHEVMTHLQMICGCNSSGSSSTCTQQKNADSIGENKEATDTNTAHVTLFCSLQSETPAQDMDQDWGHDGRVFLEPESIREMLPRPFTHYAPMAREILLQQQSSSAPFNNNKNVEEEEDYSNNSNPIFIHEPMKDLNIPESQELLQQLLLKLLEFLDTNTDNNDNVSNNDKAMYLHCWGGRGRAAMVGACLVSLIWPSLSAQDILDWVQRGYETRLGHTTLTEEFAHSPQTEPQRAFVRQFVQEYQEIFSSLEGNNDNL